MHEDGSQVIRYCGNGTAQIKLPLRVLEIDGADCDLNGAFATMNAGTSYSNQDEAEGDYLGVVVGGLVEGESAEANHVALELVVKGTTVPLSKPHATVDHSDAGLVTTIAAEGADGGPVQIVVSCPQEG